VCRAIGTPDSSGNGYYAVYADTPRGNANYCAYHSYGTCGGVPLQFAYFFKLDGDLQAATRGTPQDCTRRAWLPSQMSAGTNSPKHAAIPPIQVPGMTHQVPRTVTNAHGPSAHRSSPSRTIPSGRSRENGPMPPTLPVRAIPIAPVKRAASPESSTPSNAIPTHPPERPLSSSGGLLLCCNMSGQRKRTPQNAPKAQLPGRRVPAKGASARMASTG